MSTATLHIENKKTLIPQLRFQEFDGEWNNTNLGEAFTIFNGYAFASSSSVEDGVLWVKIADVGIQEMKKNNLSYLPISLKEKHKKFILTKGDFVVALTRPILNGKLKIAQINSFFDGALLNQRVGKIISNNSHYFICSLLQKDELIKSIENNIAGSDPPNLSPNEINLIKISYPSLPEQQKIASFLSVVDEKIQQLSRKKELLSQYKKGVMQQLFSSKLRFKDENGENYADWEEKKLGEIAKRVTRKNKENNLNVLTISAQLGLVSQLEYFNKSVSAKNVTNYYLLERNDFAYNKSYSNGYPMGAIKRLKKYDKGVVSTLYICFCFNEIVSLNFMEQYFEFGLHNYEIEKVAQEGARNHGLLNIGVNDFLNIALIIPSLQEQQKIADFLSSIDVKIESTNQQINQTQSFKKGLLQQLFV
jgi:type I restriction enzyme S subunit